MPVERVPSASSGLPVAHLALACTRRGLAMRLPLARVGHRGNEGSEHIVHRLGRREDFGNVWVEHDNQAIFGDTAGETIWPRVAIIKLVFGAQVVYRITTGFVISRVLHIVKVYHPPHPRARGLLRPSPLPLSRAYGSGEG